RRWIWPSYLFSLMLLGAVLIPHVGVDILGAKRWLKVGPLQIQPSELAKLAMIFLFAGLFSKHRDRLKNFWTGVVPMILLGSFVMILVLLEPDLGTTVGIAVTFFVMMFLAGLRGRHIAGLSAVVLPVFVAAMVAAPYRRQRLTAFLDPWKHPLGEGFHTIQALLALGSGGVFGVGLGYSKQALGFLPESYSDFVFAILGEELGLIGTVSVVLLFAVVAWRGYRIAMRAPDMYSGLLAAGITTMISIQAVINMGVVTATLPVTGITLPFISYGGSSLVITLAAVGVLLNISKHAL
ncbi:MAG: putative lipid II flippase FtsW, partial [Firmicutes bacterium]|nr:putative lipid II flippase FtsW [Bacillota bacterium]